MPRCLERMSPWRRVEVSTFFLSGILKRTSRLNGRTHVPLLR